MIYIDVKNRQREELNDFPMFFAFNKEQFDKGMKKIGAKNKEELAGVPGSGFILKKDTSKLKNLFKSHEEEMAQLFNNKDFLIDAMIYELNNYEYTCTGDPQPALLALGIELDSEEKVRCFNIAKQIVLQQEC